MDNEQITLELLVRKGNIKGVEKFVDSKGYNGEKKTEKRAETGIYYAIRKMWEQAEGGIDSVSICNFLNQEIYKNYFASTTNTVLLEDLIDVLIEGTHAQMEAYAQITAIDIFGMDIISDAIKRNLDNNKIKEKAKEFVKNGYSLVFCPFDIDKELVNYYFPLIDKWRDLINPLKFTEEVIEDFAGEADELMDFDYKKEFLDAAIDKLIELTDRQTVSNLIYDGFKEEHYEKFVKEKKIDKYNPDFFKRIKEISAEGIPKKIVDAVKEYENSGYVFSLDVEHLEEVVNEKGKEYIAKKMGEWFKQGKLRHVAEIAKYKNQKLYDHEIAKKEIGKGIEAAIEKGNLVRLGWILDFPEYLIDKENEKIKAVVEAYNINKGIESQG